MDIRYPIGKFQYEGPYSEAERARKVSEIAALPQLLRQAAGALTEQQLETPYREGGWTIRQVVHHLADSHLNSALRFRFALTEPEYTIKTYPQQDWAELADAKSAPVEASLSLLEGLHERWVILLNSLTAAQVQTQVIHPEIGRITLDFLIGLYAWHGRHHLEHIRNAPVTR